LWNSGKQRHLEHGFPATDPAKIEVLTAIEETTSGSEFFFN
jgi:hypothetical protein